MFSYYLQIWSTSLAFYPYIVVNNPDGIFIFGRAPGIQTLIDSSLDRGVGLHDELITISNEMQSGGTRTFKMHRKCRTYYIEMSATQISDEIRTVRIKRAILLLTTRKSINLYLPCFLGYCKAW